ncbi:DUF397 domain-containing protein [Kitasatospora purpeofusca]|uniref:DUF397 domain-containing protein n=1 Tax=Kitasatospora purpeofusca TaxID=67352 RepID=UPI002A59B0AA|nr:DUF397 domain-containing protein [Kitasatospora purpeofusca]MDY0810506.1 DUF397 domain-containing protein [Kitasatospora purpeofusca]
MTFVPNSTAVTAEWKKSSRSGGNGDCVEIAFADDLRYVRDSKDPEGPALILSAEAHAAFIAAAAAGEFDLDLI